MTWLHALLLLLRTLSRSRRQLALENLALRQQLIVLRRKVGRPTVADRDRRFWLLMRRLNPAWRSCLHLVTPATVLRWHKKGYCAWWRFKSRGRKPGRPAIDWRLINLIKRLARENPSWGSPHITKELIRLGFNIGKTTVERYMPQIKGRGQGWMTFLRNHMGVTCACDFFVVHTITFQRLYAFVVLSHDRRRIVHVAVTPHPTSEWTARQLLEAFPGDGSEPGILLHDNDPLFKDAFQRQVEVMNIKDLHTRARSPWMNCFCERVIGSIRRDCTDHFIVINELHLTRILNAYVEYYNRSRTHLSLEGDTPISRPRETTPAYRLKATPVLGGLHHRYERAAA
ncbi:MAG: integrase core domain-containing protein [Planctomycetota bacterium]